MSRVQLALNVDNLAEGVAFYSKLFNTQPAKLKEGYANFAIAEPPLLLLRHPRQGVGDRSRRRKVGGLHRPGGLRHLRDHSRAARCRPNRRVLVQCVRQPPTVRREDCRNGVVLLTA